MLFEILVLLVSSFIIGFSGAIAPGPMLSVTVSEAVPNGAKTGLFVSLGHMISEILLLIIILAGAAWLISSDTSFIVIGLLGGVILIIMGILNIRDSKNYKSLSENTSTMGFTVWYKMVFKGLVASLANPYLYIWWAVIGLGFLVSGYKVLGVLGIVFFLIGHWLSDFTWFGLVSFVVSRFNRFINEVYYKWIMYICGSILLGVGFYLLYTCLNHILFMGGV